MGEAYLDWQNKTGGIKLNDVIEVFKYVYKGQEVKAGDFVNYINGIAGKVDYGESVDTQLSTQTNSGYAISAVQLDENRVFVAHSRTYNASANTKNLYGMVVIINGATITYGADKEIVSSAPSGTSVSACKLSNDRVFLAYPDTNNNYLYGIVVTIEGNTVKTSANSKAIVSESGAGINVSTCLIAENKIFIAHRYGNNYLYGIVVTISDTTITTGADTVLVSTESAGYAISTCLLPNGKLFIAHSYGSNLYLYGMVVSISGTAITKGTDTQLVTTAQAGGYISTQLLPNGNVFAAYRGGSGEDYCLYGMVVSINGTTISKGIDTQLSNLSRSGIKTNLALLDNGQVLIIHSYSTNNHIYGIICSINGTTITAGTDTMLNNNAYTSYALSTLLLDNGTIFTTHSHTQNSYYLHAQIFAIDYENNIPTNNIVITEYEQQVTPAIEPPFNAVALSSGVGGTDTQHNEQVKIARVYKEVEKEVTKTGDIFNKTWNEIVAYEQYQADDGTKLIADCISTNPAYIVTNAFDSDTSTRCAASENGASMKLEFIKPIKITKMKTWIDQNQSASFTVIIQGSNNDSEWTNLYTINSAQSKLITIELNNTDFFKFYQMYIICSSASSSSFVRVYEWQTSEYIEKVTEVIQ